MRAILVFAVPGGEPREPERPAPEMVRPQVATVDVAAALGWRVLVVDDEQDILETIADLLPAFFQGALQVETAASAEEALVRLRSGERFDVVLSDHRMPGMQGLELLSMLRTERPECVRVLMTAYHERDLQRRARSEGGVHMFLTKPFELPEVADRLGQLLDERLAQAGPPGQA